MPRAALYGRRTFSYAVKETRADKERRMKAREGRRTRRDEGERGRPASNGSEKLFRYDRNLRTRPAAGIRTSRTTATPLDFLLVSQPSLRSIRDFNSAICGGDVHASGNDAPPQSDMHACRAEIARARAFVHAGDWRVTSKITLIAHAMWITWADPVRSSRCGETSAALKCIPLRRGTSDSRAASTIKAKCNKKFERSVWDSANTRDRTSRSKIFLRGGYRGCTPPPPIILHGKSLRSQMLRPAPTVCWINDSARNIASRSALLVKFVRITGITDEREAGGERGRQGVERGRERERVKGRVGYTANNWMN